MTTEEFKKLKPEYGKLETLCYCYHCREEFDEEPNTNISHKLYKLGKCIVDIFWTILDKTHIIRSSFSGRYGVGGDESRYVKVWHHNFKSGTSKYELRKRKWWEHILIEKPVHNF